jgi:glycosyltransferase involved in cell wall biosynthesis
LTKQVVPTDTNLSIIIPAFNEEESIGATIDGVRNAVETCSIDFEVIVVDDGSSDKTLEIAKSKGVRVLRNDQNKGYGASLKAGIQKAQFGLIAIIDADGTYPPDELRHLLAEMNQKGFDYDMVVGSRTGAYVKIPILRKPAKWFLTQLADYLTNSKIPDLNSGLRVFKRGLIERFIDLLPDGFSLTTTITIAALTNDYQVKYIPINYYKRTGRSSIRPLQDFLGFLTLIVRLAVCFKPLNVFLPASLILVVIGLAKALIDFVHQNYFGVGAALAILTGVQIGFLGLLADLILKRTKL